MSNSFKSREISVLSFDLDDTLWPCKPTILRAEKLLYQWLLENVSEITSCYDINQLRDKRLQLFCDEPRLKHDLSKLRIRSFEVLAQEFALDENWIIPAFEVFYEARQRVSLFDDVSPVLDELTRDYQLASLTNGNADTIKTGIDHWFDFALNSATVGKMKSEPDIYRQILKMADIDALQMAHIGDDPLHDISGAKAAGVFAIWLNRDNKQWSLEGCQPDAVITSLYELPELLSELAKE